jgi:hypothetical protein
MAAAQETDDELQRFLESTNTLRLEQIQISGTSVYIYSNISARRTRPYFPTPLRLQLFQFVHDLLHPVTKATAKLVTQRFVWPGVQKDCRNWARACQSSSAPKSHDTQLLH